MGFGLVLDDTGEKIKSRSGDTIKLKELLDEARDRALNLTKKKIEEEQKRGEEEKGEEHKVIEEHKFTEEQLLHNAEVAGICSVKYFDLKQNRVQNYKFEYDKILDPKGDSGCYLLYMYARIISIFNKGGYTEQSIRELA